jgi:class 3 adenylate cyclase
MFPPHIADALREGKKIEPETKEVVTIFLSDIVGFSTLCGKLSSLKIADMFARLYSAFDDLSQAHEIFKVETIGDSYMAVTNLFKDQPDHTKRIADFAVDAVRTANKTLIDVDDPDKDIRVGFHSGPVVANFVGTINLRCCLFGDTVRVTSWLEATSDANRIHCSDIAARFLGEQCSEFPLCERGYIPVKGKGNIMTYWVNETPLESLVEGMGSLRSTYSKIVSSPTKRKRTLKRPERPRPDPRLPAIPDDDQETQRGFASVRNVARQFSKRAPSIRSLVTLRTNETGTPDEPPVEAWRKSLDPPSVDDIMRMVH